MAAGGKVIVNAGALTADATKITTTLEVAGATTLTGALAANGGITVDNTAFVVADTSGNVSTTGTLTVTGLTTLNGGITADGGAFAVANTSGNITTTGTLTVTGAVSAANAVLSSHATGGIGYATGAGGAVTQATDRTTGVTLNKICGTITTHNASLAAGAEATFTVTNSAVAATDVVVVSLQDKSATALSIPFVTDVTAGAFNITLTNLDASTADTSASKINFVVIKSVAA